jgi:hypothetical protein
MTNQVAVTDDVAVREPVGEHCAPRFRLISRAEDLEF